MASLLISQKVGEKLSTLVEVCQKSMLLRAVLVPKITAIDRLEGGLTGRQEN